MSKSLDRVKAALRSAGADVTILEMSESTRTAADAARAANCEIDQIAKSIVFRGDLSESVFVFLTAGGRQVDPTRAAHLAGEPLSRADANLVRSVTGFAIGGVAPVGHLVQPAVFFDVRLLDFPLVWAAAGTPRHIFAIDPDVLLRVSRAKPADFAH